ncbi:putative G2-specific protein kinase nimA [Blattamonas nauphoetae]|uniref:non-specific serine/threonine protein kinase n=1 Tax=Blattamonas nauphoetae TaxID=2049346 RepID=A0ABQ9X581_9EUKA|nr:putative G2-specific protein kinase nimA [Blattamonas nauphoetae]
MTKTIDSLFLEEESKVKYDQGKSIHSYIMMMYTITSTALLSLQQKKREQCYRCAIRGTHIYLHIIKKHPGYTDAVRQKHGKDLERKGRQCLEILEGLQPIVKERLKQGLPIDEEQDLLRSSQLNVSNNATTPLSPSEERNLTNQELLITDNPLNYSIALPSIYAPAPSLSVQPTQSTVPIQPESTSEPPAPQSDNWWEKEGKSTTFQLSYESSRPLQPKDQIPSVRPQEQNVDYPVLPLPPPPEPPAPAIQQTIVPEIAPIQQVPPFDQMQMPPAVENDPFAPFPSSSAMDGSLLESAALAHLSYSHFPVNADPSAPTEQITNDPPKVNVTLFNSSSPKSDSEEASLGLPPPPASMEPMPKHTLSPIPNLDSPVIVQPPAPKQEPSLSSTSFVPPESVPVKDPLSFIPPPPTQQISKDQLASSTAELSKSISILPPPAKEVVVPSAPLQTSSLNASEQPKPLIQPDLQPIDSFVPPISKVPSADALAHSSTRPVSITPSPPPLSKSFSTNTLSSSIVLPHPPQTTNPIPTPQINKTEAPVVLLPPAPTKSQQVIQPPPQPTQIGQSYTDNTARVIPAPPPQTQTLTQTQNTTPLVASHTITPPSSSQIIPPKQILKTSTSPLTQTSNTAKVTLSPPVVIASPPNPNMNATTSTRSDVSSKAVTTIQPPPMASSVVSITPPPTARAAPIATSTPVTFAPPTAATPPKVVMLSPPPTQKTVPAFPPPPQQPKPQQNAVVLPSPTTLVPRGYAPMQQKYQMMTQPTPTIPSFVSHPNPNPPFLPSVPLQPQTQQSQLNPNAMMSRPAPPGVDIHTTLLIHETGVQGQSRDPIRHVFLSSSLFQMFIQAAHYNNSINVETCGMLCGRIVDVPADFVTKFRKTLHGMASAPTTNTVSVLVITQVVMPPQHGTSDTVVAEKEEVLEEYITTSKELIMIGWIHTHPTQKAFLSSVDLHTQLPYQMMMPESIAIVVALKEASVAVFTLSPSGQQTIQRCPLRGFHRHDGEQIPARPFYGIATHATVLDQREWTAFAKNVTMFSSQIPSNQFIADLTEHDWQLQLVDLRGSRASDKTEPVTYTLLLMPQTTLSDFDTKKRIGRGAHGDVFLTVRKADQKQYCLKAVALNELSDKEQEAAIRETHVLAALNSPYVVKYNDSFIENDTLYIVMEYAPHGTLQDLITHKQEMKGKFDESEIWKFFIQIYFHKKNIIHRDLKPQNVFIGSEYTLKIGDFGVAKSIPEEGETTNNLHSTLDSTVDSNLSGTQDPFALSHSGSRPRAQSLVGTPYYLSPELLNSDLVTPSCDIWAMGCILYELATLQRPFDASNAGALIVHILTNDPEPVPSSYSGTLSNMVMKMLQKDPRNRPTIDEVLTTVREVSLWRVQPLRRKKNARLSATKSKVELEKVDKGTDGKETKKTENEEAKQELPQESKPLRRRSQRGRSTSPPNREGVEKREDKQKEEKREEKKKDEKPVPVVRRKPESFFVDMTIAGFGEEKKEARRAEKREVKEEKIGGEDGGGWVLVVKGEKHEEQTVDDTKKEDEKKELDKMMEEINEHRRQSNLKVQEAKERMDKRWKNHENKQPTLSPEPTFLKMPPSERNDLMVTPQPVISPKSKPTRTQPKPVRSVKSERDMSYTQTIADTHTQMTKSEQLPVKGKKPLHSRSVSQTHLTTTLQAPSQTINVLSTPANSLASPSSSILVPNPFNGEEPFASPKPSILPPRIVFGNENKRLNVKRKRDRSISQDREKMNDTSDAEVGDYVPSVRNSLNLTAGRSPLQSTYQPLSPSQPHAILSPTQQISTLGQIVHGSPSEDWHSVTTTQTTPSKRRVLARNKSVKRVPPSPTKESHTVSTPREIPMVTIDPAESDDSSGFDATTDPSKITNIPHYSPTKMTKQSRRLKGQKPKHEDAPEKQLPHKNYLPLERKRTVVKNENGGTEKDERTLMLFTQGPFDRDASDDDQFE